MPLSREDCVFFWKTNEIHGWGSQWYPSKFTATIKLNGKEETVEFPSAEHWMMIQKALLFSDFEMARTMLGVKGDSQKHMTEIKALGRKVANFDEKVWVDNRERIVLEGSLHKFRQNEELKEALLATGVKTIIEASPRDRIWGIGFGEKNSLSQKDRWGLNLLGKALEEARTILKQEQEQLENSQVPE
ncbi:DUF1768-domain-containing protein [Coprinopsis marcescibilis]|uniref:DUF1768-domain-containing protein n=1 Tax=Coprinopsis marcescibilis TaxID=230819 RepID=A0A5C3KAR3_COPMA|nr:DUF1768-domain-containing protein [Coprinopsis marcescibilis]